MKSVDIELLAGKKGSNSVLRVCEEVGHPVFFEKHERFTDVFTVTSGRVLFVFGGELINPKGQRNGEWLGSGISGGKAVELERGDVLVVKAGKPHTHRVIGADDFSMVVVKMKVRGKK